MQVVDQEKRSSLLSPPTSPRMSAYPASSPHATWQSNKSRTPRPSALSIGFEPFPAVTEDAHRPQVPPIDTRPQLLRSQKSFPYTLTTTSFGTPHQHSPLNRVENPESCVGENVKGIHQPRHVESGRIDAALPIRSESAPSPHAQLTPTSPDPVHDGMQGDTGDELDMGLPDLDEEEETLGEGESAKTAAERRAEKRKMKRFRLTHNQTRFLMSEFTRQAHPDAAHRERLSREIPGLSPRQVQVWFQNRRAKLKRLTTDDRERVLKSRALPEDFDVNQTLHSPYGGHHGMGTPLASPVSYLPAYHDGTIMRPLMMEGLRRQSEDEMTTSPMSMSSAYGNFFTPPGSVVTSDNVSPVSTTSDRPWNAMPGSLNTSPRNSNPFTRSSSFSTAYHHPQIPRLQLHDRVSRTRAESLGSPLRSSMSYTGNALDYRASHRTGVLASNYGQGQTVESQQHSNSSRTRYGMAHQNEGFQGFQSAALARVRPLPPAFPPGLQLKSDYPPSSEPIAPQSAQFAPVQSAPLVPPPEYSLQSPQLSAPYHTTSFNVTYGHHNTSTMGVPTSLQIYDRPHPRIEEVPCEETSTPLYEASRQRSYTHPQNYPSH